MPLEIIRQDITAMSVDVIVNATNTNLLPDGGGVDQQIHNAAGSQLLDACLSLGGCEIGQAKITPGFNLPAKYVIHTTGPIWNGGENNERVLLADCYSNCLQLAKEHKCESIAFPLISSGTYDFPKDEVLRIAIKTVSDFLFENDMMVYIVVFDRQSFSISTKLFKDIEEYIDDNYAAQKEKLFPQNYGVLHSKQEAVVKAVPPRRSHCQQMMDEWMSMPSVEMVAEHADYSILEAIEQMDESFAQCLLRKIDEKGITDAQCYKKANVSKQLFNKIKNNPDHKPTKPTVVAFAIALELSLEETEDLLKKAGFALSNSSKFDVIIRYFIEKKNYDIFEINEVLFYYDQILLGV